MKMIKLASYQGPIVENDVDANLKKVYEVIEEQKSSAPDFLCFPETYLTGYTEEAIRDSALSADDPRIGKLIESTSGHDMVILVGLAEKEKGAVYNTQLVMHNGKLLGKAHKTMLTQGYDDKYFATDLDLPVFEAKGIKFGIAICHTTSFVEPALYLRYKGARLLFTPHFNNVLPDIKDPKWKSGTYSRHRTMVLNNQAALAVLLKMVVVRSNIIQISETNLGSGDSNIWGMDGELIAAGHPFCEEVVTASVPREQFIEEHSISRKEVPSELLRMIWEASKEY